MQYSGEIAGLGAALLWAYGGMICAKAGRHVGSNAVNEMRLILALPILLVAHAVVFGASGPWDAAPMALTWLAVSGFVGLALGDMCFFHSITVLGPRIGALLMATAPAMTAVLAWIVLEERLTVVQILGMIVTSVGILIVLRDKRGRVEWDENLSAGARRFGVTTGLLAAFGQALGNVLSKLGANAGSVELAPLSSVVVRMTAGTVGILAIAALAGRLPRTLRAFRVREARRPIMLAVVLGPTLGVWCYQVALQRTDAAVAAILVSLVPIFMIPIARVTYGARPSRAALAGTLVAFVGTFMLLLATPSTSAS